MEFSSIGANTKATILLTNRLGEAGTDLKPLSPAQFRSVQAWLAERGLSVGDLLTGKHEAATTAMIEDGVGTASISSLLDRIPNLIQSVERWAELGIWIIGETDDGFPARLRDRLGGTGFPLLFGAGKPEILNQGGVYIVGSRNTSESGLRFSRVLAKRCGEEEITVISSDMRGADREAMGASDGHIVCVLSDSLEKAVVAKRHRQLLEQGKLTILTPFSPEARFRVANAIRVNRYQYCLADLAVIVETRRTGGVWLGAEENRKENWVPAFVRVDEDVPLGNEALLSLGYMSLSETEISECEKVGDYLISRLTTESVVQTCQDSSSVTPEIMADRTLFDLFCEQLRSIADSVACSPSEMQNHFDIEPEQAESWIARALEEGVLEEVGDTDHYRIRHWDR